MLKSKISQCTDSSSTQMDVMHTSAIGIDVHRDILVCHYQAGSGHTLAHEGKEFKTTSEGLSELTKWCQLKAPEVIGMESTGVLWRSTYEALEKVGYTRKELVVLNARTVKALMGKKTDKTDARRLARFLRLGDFNESFIPRFDFREQRAIARSYSKAVQTVNSLKQERVKLLNESGTRIMSVFSDSNGKSVQRILEAFLAGEDLLTAIKTHRDPRCRRSVQEIFDALKFEITPTYRKLINLKNKQIRSAIEAKKGFLDLLREMQAPYQKYIDLITSIPSINEISARLIFAEISDEVCEVFSSVEKFCSWCGLAPGNNESAKKAKPGCPTVKGNSHVRKAFIECAHALARSKKTNLVKKFEAFKLRRGTRKAIVATAHLLARILYALMKTGRIFEERACDADKNAVCLRIQKLRKSALHNGYLLAGTNLMDTKSGEVTEV